MDKERPTYFSYLLRIWRDDEAPYRPGSKTIRLASLQSSLTGQRQGFASLDDLFAFLRRQAGAVSDAESDEARTKGQ
jgi:hypothetical protein